MLPAFEFDGREKSVIEHSGSTLSVEPVLLEIGTDKGFADVPLERERHFFV